MAELMAVTLRLQQLGRNSTSAVRLAQDKVDELTTMAFVTGVGDPQPGDRLRRLAQRGRRQSQRHAIARTTARRTTLPTTRSSKGYTRRWLIAAGPDGDP